MERRLTAIFAADVVGYTRLMGRDEAGTLRRLTELRQQVLEPLITKHLGRIVKLMGDGFLVEFASIVDALNCAVAWQRDVAQREATGDDDKRIRFRIGVNLGDVIVEGDDIFGDGVNIAARLEAFAEPDGICISDDAYRQAKGKVDVEFKDLGNQELKNVAEPVRIFRIVGDNFEESTGSPGNRQVAAPPLPEKPSIAILPFENMGGDLDQGFFADGMAEDIITALSRFRWLFVIARNSAFAYKSSSIDIRDVGRDLGVRYVLEGSVRKAGARVRVTAQLIDASSGNHLWAERYDRDLEDIFAVQDEITGAIVRAIEPEMAKSERDRARSQTPSNLNAWGLYQRGLASYYSSATGSWQEAIDLFDSASSADPNFAPAYAMAAEARCYYVLQGIPGQRDQLLEAAERAASTSISLDPTDPLSLFADGRVHSFLGRHVSGIEKMKQAIAINPNFALAHYGLGYILAVSGQSEDALKTLDTALRLSPRDAISAGFLTMRALAVFDLGRYEEAGEWARRAADCPNPRFWSSAVLAASLNQLGRAEEAQRELKKLLTLKPEFSLEFVRQAGRHYAPEILKHRIALFEAVGVPH